MSARRGADRARVTISANGSPQISGRSDDIRAVRSAPLMPSSTELDVRPGI
jgi:hypothetical protein